MTVKKKTFAGEYTSMDIIEDSSESPDVSTYTDQTTHNPNDGAPDLSGLADGNHYWTSTALWAYNAEDSDEDGNPDTANPFAGDTEDLLFILEGEKFYCTVSSGTLSGNWGKVELTISSETTKTEDDTITEIKVKKQIIKKYDTTTGSYGYWELNESGIDVGPDLAINGSTTTVDGIQTTITDTDDKIPTSGAIVDYIDSDKGKTAMISASSSQTISGAAQVSFSIDLEMDSTVVNADSANNRITLVKTGYYKLTLSISGYSDHTSFSPNGTTIVADIKEGSNILGRTYAYTHRDSEYGGSSVTVLYNCTSANTHIDVDANKQDINAVITHRYLVAEYLGS